MKNAVLCIMIMILMGCEDPLQFLDEENETPEIGIRTLNEDGDIVYVAELSDKLKTSLKTGKDRYRVVFKINDVENGSLDISASIITGLATLELNEEEMNLPVDVSELEEVTLDIIPSEVGIVETKVALTDEIGKENFVEITLEVFDNLTPVADFSYEKIALHSSSQYEFDGSLSLDRDSEYGGGLSYYEWTFTSGSNNDSYVVLRDEPTFRQDLAPGGYDVSLVAIDNDGKRSEPKSKIIQVN